MMSNPFLSAMPMYNPMQQATQANPFIQYYGNLVQQPWKIPKVKGREGANAFEMPADSEALLLDQDDPIVWLVQTDSARTKTINAFDISVHEDEEKKTMASLEERISKLEKEMQKRHEPDYVDVAFEE